MPRPVWVECICFHSPCIWYTVRVNMNMIYSMDHAFTHFCCQTLYDIQYGSYFYSQSTSYTLWIILLLTMYMLYSTDHTFTHHVVYLIQYGSCLHSTCIWYTVWIILLLTMYMIYSTVHAFNHQVYDIQYGSYFYSPSDVEIVVHPGILVPRRILSWQKDSTKVFRTCGEIKIISIFDFLNLWFYSQLKIWHTV